MFVQFTDELYSLEVIYGVTETCRNKHSKFVVARWSNSRSTLREKKKKPKKEGLDTIVKGLEAEVKQTSMAYMSQLVEITSRLHEWMMRDLSLAQLYLGIAIR